MGEQENLDDLLEDLDLLEPGHDHYTGTIVLHKRGTTHQDETGKSYVEVDVVDGQQRLTTLILLLDALRRELLGLKRPHRWQVASKAPTSAAAMKMVQPFRS